MRNLSIISGLALLLLAYTKPIYAIDANTIFTGARGPLNIFTPDMSDTSLHLLGQLFGNMPPILKGTSQLLPHVFNLLNSGIYIFAVVLLSYMTWKGLLVSAGSGAFLGKDTSAIILVRILFGVVALVPRFNGYSFIQVAVMWVILHGIGLANVLWHSAWKYIDQSDRNAAIIPTEFSSVQYKQATDFVTTLARSLICTSEYEDLLLKRRKEAKREIEHSNYGELPTARYNELYRIAYGEIDVSPTITDYGISFPGSKGDNPLARENGKCGRFEWSAAERSNLPNAYIQQIIRSILESLRTFVEQVRHPTEETKATTDIGLLAGSVSLAQAVNQYLTLIRYGISEATETTSNITLTPEGWIMAARDYYKLVAASKPAPDFIQGSYISLDNQNNDLPIISSEHQERLNTYNQQTNKWFIKFTSSRKSELRSDLESSMNKAMDEITELTDQPNNRCNKGVRMRVVGEELFSSIIQCDIRYMIMKIYRAFVDSTLSDMDHISRYVRPLKRIHQLGMSLLGQPVVFWQNIANDVFDILVVKAGLYTGVAMGIMLPLALLYGHGKIKTMASQMFSAGAYLMQMLFKIDVIETLWYLPFGLALAVPIAVMGLMLGIYAPLMPFILFIFGAIGWFIATIEAMIASPLIPLGLAHPERHEFLGSAEQAVMLLLGIFLRPSCIIIGFVVAIALLSIGIDFLNQIFFPLISSQLAHFDTFYTGTGNHDTKIMAVLGGLLWFYVIAVFTVVSHVLSFIYQVPNRILSVIGLPPESPLEMQVIDQGEQEMQQTGEQMAKGAGESSRMGARRAERVRVGGQFWVMRTMQEEKRPLEAKLVDEGKDGGDHGGGNVDSGQSPSLIGVGDNKIEEEE